MTSVEFLRKLHDMISLAEDSSTVPTVPKETDELHVEIENPQSEDGEVMVPPLQAELELMKKAVGVDSFYDSSSDNEKEPEVDIDATPAETNIEKVDQNIEINSDDTELNRIRQNAGLMLTVFHNSLLR